MISNSEGSEGGRTGNRGNVNAKAVGWGGEGEGGGGRGAKAREGPKERGKRRGERGRLTAQLDCHVNSCADR